MLLARGLLGAGDIRRAEPEILSLLKTYPRSAAVHSLAGAMFLTQRDLPSAKKAFEQALQLDVDHREALTQLVNVYAETNNLGEAHRIIERQLTKAPADTGLLLLAARTYATGRDFSHAEKILKKVIAQDATNILAFGMLGEIKISERRLEAAGPEYEKRGGKGQTAVT